MGTHRKTVNKKLMAIEEGRDKAEKREYKTPSSAYLAEVKRYVPQPQPIWILLENESKKEQKVEFLNPCEFASKPRNKNVKITSLNNLSIEFINNWFLSNSENIKMIRVQSTIPYEKGKEYNILLLSSRDVNGNKYEMPIQFKLHDDKWQLSSIDKKFDLPITIDCSTSLSTTLKPLQKLILMLFPQEKSKKKSS